MLITPLMMYAVLFEISRSNGLYLDHSWVWTHDSLHTRALLLGGSFAVAAGFWQGGRDRRRGTGELLSSTPSPPLRRTALAAAPAVLWPLVGYLLTVAAAFVLTWTSREMPGSHPLAGLLVVDAVAIASLGLLGFVAGRVIPWWPAGPVLAVLAGYCMHSLAGGNLPALILHQDALRAIGPTTAHGTPWEMPVWWYVPVAVVWFAGPALAALLACSGFRRRAAAVPLAVALAAGGVLAGTGNDLWRTDRAATALTCDTGTPEVCTVRGAHSLSEAAGLLRGIRAKLRGIPDAPARLIEVPLPGTGHPAAKARGKDDALLDPPLADFRTRPEGYRTRAAYTIAQFGCTRSLPQFTSPVPPKYSSAVAAWLAPSPDEPFPGSEKAVLARIEAMSQQRRTAWLSDYFAAVRDCRPDRIEAP